MTMACESSKIWANRYKSLNMIGNGGYGKVYKIKDCKMTQGIEMIKALKEIPLIDMDNDAIEECAREAKFLAKINHLNIVKLFDSFCCVDFYCIVTEFCDGGDLDQLIVKNKRAGRHLDEKRILRWFIQIIRALHYIHQRRILHRDLKCRNVFLKNDSVKLGDFGISRILNCTFDLASTFVGTAHYMSPEVLKHDGYNTGSDIWSAGVILYELCALKHAFDAQGLMSLMMLIVDGPCPTIPDNYSDNLQEIIEKILTKDPSKRPATHDILEFPYISKTMKEPWIDLTSIADLSQSMMKQETDDIHSYISNPNTPVSIQTPEPYDNDDDGNENTLTPKQKLQLKKQKKADMNAESLKTVTTEIYKENRLKSAHQRAQVQSDHLPFARQRNQSNDIFSNSEDRRRHAYGIQTQRSPMQRSQSETSTPPILDLNATFTYDKSYVPLVNRMPLGKAFDNSQLGPPLNNEHELFHVLNDNNKSIIRDTSYSIDNTANDTIADMYRHLQQHHCNAIHFRKDDIPEDVAKEIAEYSDDFEASSDSTNDDSKQENVEEFGSKSVPFRDKEDTDPYGNASKMKKMDSMRQKCLKLIDEATFNKAMECLKKRPSKNQATQLRKICRDENAAFLVEQIHFLYSERNVQTM